MFSTTAAPAMTPDTTPDATATTSNKRRGRLAATAVAALVAIIASIAAFFVVAGPASATSAYGVNHSRTSYEHWLAYQILYQINDERRANGLSPVSMNGQLMTSARRHDMNMAHFNEMSHQLPNEAFFANRMTAAGYRWTMAGENIAWNSRMSLAGVQQVQSMMYNEQPPYDGHRLNILNSNFRNVGVDVYLDMTNQKVWLTTDFGRP